MVENIFTYLVEMNRFKPYFCHKEGDQSSPRNVLYILLTQDMYKAHKVNDSICDIAHQNPT